MKLIYAWVASGSVVLLCVALVLAHKVRVVRLGPEIHVDCGLGIPSTGVEDVDGNPLHIRYHPYTTYNCPDREVWIFSRTQ